MVRFSFVPVQHVAEYAQRQESRRKTDDARQGSVNH